MTDTPGPSSVELAPGVVVPAERLLTQFVRASGPGGQNVNKLSTRCVLRLHLRDLPLPRDTLDRLRRLAGHRLVGFGPDEALLIGCDRHRSQERNRHDALAELRKLLTAAMKRPRPRRPTRPTRSSQRRRLDSKRQRGHLKRQRRGEPSGD